MAARCVHALRCGEITLWVGTLVNVNAFRKVGELFLFTAGDDVAPDQPETFVASNLGLILIVIGLSLILYDPIFNFWELEASFPGTVGHIGRPGSVGLAEQGGQTRPFIARVALIPDHCPVVQALPSKLVGGCVVNLAQWWALGRWGREGEQTKTWSRG